MAKAHKTARLIVFGNAKGGSGKSTCALHTAIALMQAGHRVGTVDLDDNQQTFTRAIANRSAWNDRTGRQLLVPVHACIPKSFGDSVSGRRQQELAAFADIIASMESEADYVVVDTPGFDTALMRLVHGLADILVTPVNDSFVDIDLLARPEDDGIVPGPYAELVAEAREQRRHLDDGRIDWIVVQNRLSMILSNNKIKVRDTLEGLAPKLGFRLASGVAERMIFREFFPLGVTAFDPLDETTLGVKPNMSHVAARDEFRRLVSVITFRPRTRAVRAKPPKEALDGRVRAKRPARTTYSKPRATDPVEEHVAAES